MWECNLVADPNPDAKIQDTMPGGAVSLGFPSLPIPSSETTASTTTSSRTEGEEDFLLRAPIGRGGQGTVWAAWQRRLDREVAVKIYEGHDPSGFLREAYVTAELQHPNIVPVHDLGSVRCADGSLRLVMAMKRIAGRSLAEVIDEDHGSEAADLTRILIKRLPIVVSICNAVAYAHDRGFLHLDIKPSQVIVGEYGEVALMDWGLAISTELEAPQLPGTEEIKFRTRDSIQGAIGTPAYMAPEQAAGDTAQLGPWTDVYLLGALTASLATGRPLREGDSQTSTLQAAVRNERSPLPATLPASLRSILERSTATRPEDRFPSVLAFQEAIAGFHRNLGRQEESIRLAHQAAEDAGRCDAAYAQYAAREGLLERALVLWPENEEARALMRQTLGAHAEHALEQSDLELAADLLTRLGDDERAAGLQRRLVEARSQVRRSERLRRVAITASLVLLASLAVVAIGAYWQVSRALEAAAAAREEARYEAYVAGIRAAGSAIADNRPRASRDFLFRAPEEHRSWEWLYLLSAAFPERRIQEPPLDLNANPPPPTVHVSSDDRWRAQIGEDGTLSLVAEDGRPPERVLGRVSSRAAVAFSPDSRYLLAATETVGVNAFFVTTGEIFRRLDFDKGPIGWVFSDRDTGTVVIAGDSVVSVYNRDLILEHQFIPDLGSLVGVQPDFPAGEITLHTQSGESLVFGLYEDEAHFRYPFISDPITYMETADTAPFRVVVTEKGEIRRLSLAGQSAELMDSWFIGPGIQDLDVSGSGQIMAAIDGNGVPRLRWPGGTVAALPIERARALALHPQSDVVAIAQEEAITFFSFTGEEMGSLPLPRVNIGMMDWASDGSILAGASSDGSLVLIDGQTYGLQASIETPHEWLDLRLNKSATLVAGATAGCSAYVYRVEDATLLRQIEGPGEAPMRSLDFSPDGRRLLTAGWDGFLRVWDLETGRELLSLEAHRFAATHLRMDWTSGLLATFGLDRWSNNRRPFLPGQTPAAGGTVDSINEALRSRVSR